MVLCRAPYQPSSQWMSPHREDHAHERSGRVGVAAGREGAGRSGGPPPGAIVTPAPVLDALDPPPGVGPPVTAWAAVWISGLAVA